MVLRTGQRRENEEFQDVERQFALDDLDIAQDRFLGVAGKADDVAGIGDGAGLAPCLQHRAIFGDAVLPLLGAQQILRVDVLQPDEHPTHTGAAGLRDEVRDAVAQRVHLDGEADVQPFLAQRDHPVEQRFPVTVAREIVVGDEEALDALRDVLADDPLQVIRRAEAALASLHVDDGAERALIRAAAAQIDAGQRAGRTAHMLARQDRRRFALQRRQIVHEIVERCQLSGPGIAEHRVEAPFLGLAGEEA